MSTSFLDRLPVLLRLPTALQADVQKVETWQELHAQALASVSDPDRATALLEAGAQLAALAHDFDGQIHCLLAKADVLVTAGRGLEAVFAVGEAERVASPHKKVSLSQRVAIKLRMSSLYRNVMGNLEGSQKLLLEGLNLLQKEPLADYFALANVNLQLSERALDALDWQDARYRGQEVVSWLRKLRSVGPDGKLKEYHGKLYGYWSALSYINTIWPLVIEQVAMGKDSNSEVVGPSGQTDGSLNIDSHYWNLLRDPYVQCYRRNEPDIAFRLEYIGTWLGYMVLEHASPDADWEQALYWRALRLPAGNTQTIPRPELAIPSTVQKIPLIERLMAVASENQLRKGGTP